MKKTKFLTGDIFGTDVDSHERAAILRLRALVTRLTKSEATALAVILVNSYSIFDGRWVGVSALRGFTQDLADAVLMIQALSPFSKLAIAIELLADRLQTQIEAEAEYENDDEDY